MKKLKQTYTNLNEVMYSSVMANKITKHEIGYVNKQCVADFGFEESFLTSKEGMDLFVGNPSDLTEGYIAQAYCGHQFGHFNILGDGRAMLIGEIEANHKSYDVQLKGSGKTLYSRSGDGLGTYSSMMRELLMSEAMHGLGVETTRSLLVMKTGEKIYRYGLEDAAILTRVASSHIRVGTFQFASIQDDINIVKELADYTIKKHYPQLLSYEDKYQLLLRSVIVNQANLIAKWQSLGFIHGVMNTDNMTISGETIDYGPCAFMNGYDPKTVYSQIDRNGRYAFHNQPYIAAWNLARFAETLFPLLSDDQDIAVKIANEEISRFKELYETSWLSIMGQKIGLEDPNQKDQILIEELLGLMFNYQKDYTNTFRLLSKHLTDGINPIGPVFDDWYEKWIKRLDDQGLDLDQVKSNMQKLNPYVIPRNAWVEQVLASDSTLAVDEFLEVFKNPYDYSGKYEKHTEYDDEQNYSTHCNT